MLKLSSEFSQIHDKVARVKFFEKLFETARRPRHAGDNFLDDFEKFQQKKSNTTANECRDEGNNFFMRRQFKNALESYNKSLCFAEPGSDLAGIAFANRSAVFFELKLFKLCMEDIEKAKQHNAPSSTLEKLNAREQKCLKMLDDDIQEESSKLIGGEFLKLSHDPNPDIPYIADCLKLETNETFGRHIVTTKSLMPGDVIAIEEPFSAYLQPSDCYKRCANCLKDNFHNLMPCPCCTVTMFCSNECETTANKKFHQFECPIVTKLNSFEQMYARLAIRTFFDALDVCGGSVEKLKLAIKENSPGFSVFDFKHPSRFDSLKAADALTTNENKRSQESLMKSAQASAFFCNLLNKHTKLGEILESEDDRDFLRSFIYKFHQTAIINSSSETDDGLSSRNHMDSREFARAIYPFTALINHSSAPNVCETRVQGKNLIYVTRVIKEGEQIFATYGPTYINVIKQDRQDFLLKNFSFVCKCDADQKDFPLPKYSELNRQGLCREVEKDSKLDHKIGEEKTPTFCQCLIDNADCYPCFDEVFSEGCIIKCFNLFSMSHFQFKMIK